MKPDVPEILIFSLTVLLIVIGMNHWLLHRGPHRQRGGLWGLARSWRPRTWS